MTEIFAFGDSITWGAFDSKGGWVQRLRTYIESKIKDKNGDTAAFVYNLGIPGNKTPDILDRFDFEIAQRSDPEEKNKIIIFGIGGNDASYSKKDNINKIKKELFKQNLSKIIKKAKKITSNIIFIGLTQTNEEKSCPIPWNDNSYYYNRFQKEYNEVLKEICKEENVGFVEVITNFENAIADNLLDSDGLHPNDKGHEIIFKKLLDYLSKNKLI